MGDQGVHAAPPDLHATTSDWADAADRLHAAGYTGTAVIEAPQMLRCLDCQERADAAEAILEEAWRVEGTSDPGEMGLLAGLLLPCGHRVAHAFLVGSHAGGDAVGAAALAAVQDRRRAAGLAKP
ncbi:MAG: hypothetical protein ACPGQL_10270 [Thermoplasmatota archaeon]